MEVQNMNPNPRRSKQNEKQFINNPYQPISPANVNQSYMTSGMRAMIQALPYGKNTVVQEMINQRNQNLIQGTKNQQMFGESVYSSAIPGMQRV